MRDIEGEIYALTLEKDSLYQKLQSKSPLVKNGDLLGLRKRLSQAKDDKKQLGSYDGAPSRVRVRGFDLIFCIEKQRDASPWQKNLLYPLAMLLLIALMVQRRMTVLSVLLNE